MIVLSVGMPRAGSGWHYNLIHDLMQTTGCAEAGEIRSRYHLDDVLTEVNFNIGALSFRRLARVALPAVLGNTFVIKAHSKPTVASRVLRGMGLLRATYIFRDPRDAMLSAMEYGRRGLQRGRPNAFSGVVEFNAATEFMLLYLRIWQQWVREAHVLVCRYEDLLTHYEKETDRLVKHLGLSPSAPEVVAVLQRYSPERAEGVQGTHFSQGKIGRFRSVFSGQEREAMDRLFGPFLERMGYAI